VVCFGFKIARPQEELDFLPAAPQKMLRFVFAAIDRLMAWVHH
jgi:hypothetical protein